MYWPTRFLSLVFGITLLLPLIFVFVEMLRSKPISAEEMEALRNEMKADFESQVRSGAFADDTGPSMSAQMVSQGVTPFGFTQGRLFYASRKWVAVLAVCAISVLAFCIVFSALVPNETFVGSIGWEGDKPSLEFPEIEHSD